MEELIEWYARFLEEETEQQRQLRLGRETIIIYRELLEILQEGTSSRNDTATTPFITE